jgi:ketosteroid isomerase-like protein
MRGLMDTRVMPEESTTPDLVELVRQALEAENEGDFDRMLSRFATDAVWDASPQGGFVFEGRGAIREAMVDWFGVYEEIDAHNEELSDLGNGVTLVVQVQRARLPGSPALVDMRVALLMTWNGDVVQRVTTYADIDQARAAAERLAEGRG